MENFVISLQNAHDRRQHIKQQFESHNVAYKFFDAVNSFESEAVAKKLNISITDTLLGKNEIACLLSHVSIWQLVIDHNYPYVGIFEDDVYLGEDSQYYLNNVSKWKPNDAHILKLEVYKNVIQVHGRLKPLAVGARKLAKLATKHTGCAGYIIINKTAHALLDIVRNYKGLIPVDHIVFGDFLESHDANIYQIVPALCIQSQNYETDSSLGSYLLPERIQRYGLPVSNRKFKDKVIREGRRLMRQPSNAAEKIRLRLKGIRDLKLIFK